jgi:hypothetical protein
MEGSAMVAITDDFMREMLTKTRPYCVVLLKYGPQRHSEDARKIVWEHGRRNFVLRAEGKLSIVCPIPGGDDLCGVGIFNADVEETREIMDNDPGVIAGVLVYEIHASRSFPGDALPL